MTGTEPDNTRARTARLERVRGRMTELGVDALLLSYGADLPWLTGYRAMPLERLTLLVLPAIGDPCLLVPALEAPKVPDPAGMFELRPWRDEEDPLDLAAALIASLSSSIEPSSKGPKKLALSDRSWAVTLLGLEARLPNNNFALASTVTGPLRAVKDDSEVAVLRAAAAAADRVADALRSGAIPLVGRTERAVSADIAAGLVEEGHRRVNFAIVGSGPNGASPHHDAGDRVIELGDLVVCDFGGELALGDGEVGYCSDITRTFAVGGPTAEMAQCYEALRMAQQAGVDAAIAGASASSVDAAARSVIADAGYGNLFIHRTGHGIGIEEHEDPYVVAGNETVLEPGHAFSVEPGIYVEGRFGMRLEDIVVVGADGPERLNLVDHDMVVVGA